MRVLPENLENLWSDAKMDIVADHPELSEKRAGGLAAARVFNWHYEEWTALRDNLMDQFMSLHSAGAAKRIDTQSAELYGKMLEWTPLHELRDLSGSRTVLRDLDNSIVTEKSTPPAELIAIKNQWRTERIPDTSKLASVSELRQAWGNIGAEFRPRTTGEGCLYTNHQGFHAIQTTFEAVHKTSYGDSGGMTVDLISAAEGINYLRERSDDLGGKAGENLERLARLLAEAIKNAMANDRDAISVVDATHPGVGEDSQFSIFKKALRHEAAHVWEFTVHPDIVGLLSDKTIKSDPAYPIIEAAISASYGDVQPGQIESEAMAAVIAGDWKGAGFTDQEQALRFIDRFFSNVVLRYGKKALDNLHLTHPSVKEVIENVRSQTIKELRAGRSAARNVEGGSRIREFRPGRSFAGNVDGGSQSAGEGEGPVGETTRDRASFRGAQSRLAGGWSGEDAGDIRGHGAEPGAVRSSGQGIKLPGAGAEKQQQGELRHVAFDDGSLAASDRARLSEPTGEAEKSDAPKSGLEALKREQIAAQPSAENISQAEQGISAATTPSVADLPRSVTQARDIADHSRSALNAELVGSLEAISKIKSSSPESISWSTLANEITRITNKALDHEPSLGPDNHLVAAFKDIAGVMNSSDESVKGRVEAAEKIAGSTLDLARRELALAESSSVEIGYNRDQFQPHDAERAPARSAQIVKSGEPSFSF